MNLVLVKKGTSYGLVFENKIFYSYKRIAYKRCYIKDDDTRIIFDRYYNISVDGRNDKIQYSGIYIDDDMFKVVSKNKKTLIL